MLRNATLLCCILFLICAPAIAQEQLPVPKETKHRLFYLQRDPNSNTVVYDMNYTADGSLDMQKPVHAYWIKYAKGGVTEELLPIEEKLAYGVIAEMTDATEKTFKINIAAYKKIDIILKQDKKAPKKYAAYVTANGKNIQLSKVFLKLENPNSFKPTILYIEFTGKDEKTGKMITEKVIPAKNS